jgi:sec-independent protein translocase protein TatA
MELAIVVIVALIVFGPKKLPELGSSLGRGMREFKSSITGDDEHKSEDADQRPLAVTSEQEGQKIPAQPEPTKA